MQNSVGWERSGIKRRVRRTGPVSRGWGNWSRDQIPTTGHLFGTEKHLRLWGSETADVWQSEWNENHRDNPCLSPKHSRQGHKSPRKCSGWEVRCRDLRSTQGQSLLLTVGIQPEGMWGRKSWWEMLVEKNQAAMKERGYCWVITVTAFSPHANTSSWKTQKDSREVGPWHGAWHGHLTCWATENDPSQGSQAWVHWWCSLVQSSCSVVSDSLWPHGLQHARLPVHYQLLEFTQTHVHWVSDAIQSSYPLSSPSPPAFNLSQHQGLSQWISSSHQVAKVLELQL